MNTGTLVDVGVSTGYDGGTKRFWATNEEIAHFQAVAKSLEDWTYFSFNIVDLETIEFSHGDVLISPDGQFLFRVRGCRTVPPKTEFDGGYWAITYLKIEGSSEKAPFCEKWALDSKMKHWMDAEEDSRQVIFPKQLLQEGWIYKPYTD